MSTRGYNIYEGPADRQPLLAFVAAMFVILLGLIGWNDRHDSGRRALTSIAFCGAGISMIGALLLKGESLSVQNGVVMCTSHVGPFRRTRTFAASSVSRIRVEVFAFDSWDPHLAFDTPTGTLRLAWGAGEDELEALAEKFRAALEASTDERRAWV